MSYRFLIKFMAANNICTNVYNKNNVCYILEKGLHCKNALQTYYVIKFAKFSLPFSIRHVYDSYVYTIHNFTVNIVDKYKVLKTD